MKINSLSMFGYGLAKRSPPFLDIFSDRVAEPSLNLYSHNL